MKATLFQQHLHYANWHHGFNSDCPKPAPWCRSVCSPTDGVFSSGGTVTVEIILSSCTKVSDLVGGVLVYGGVSIDGRIDLYIIRDGPLTARRYRDKILRPIVVPYDAAIGDDFILMDDNCRPDRANLVEDFLFEEGIVRMEWPACSTDMNTIEYVWDALGRRVAGRQPPPQTLQELERTLLEEWDRIPQIVINSLIDSMPQRKDLIDELKIFGMSSRHHIDDFMRGRIIGKIEEGRKITDVAREFDIAHSVVSRRWRSFKTTGMCSRRHGGSSVRTQQGTNQFLAASGKQISRKTVARRLRGGELYARRPVVCVPLTRQHRTARLQWCREHHNWTEQDWACVLFSDESRFSLSSDCRCQLIWRESGTAYRPVNIQEKDQYPTCSIMVWDGIMINGRMRLHVVANGTMTGQRYIDEVLLPHVRLFRGGFCDKFVFMDDNATCHRTLIVQDCLDSEGIQRLVWPARSPDLSPIENVWDALGRQVAGRNYSPTNKNTLIRALTEEWNKLPQQLLDNVVQSMVRRVECCITLHGGHIPY
ncbi:transposable element Tcb2 transposase [Trichonephila clavipes]|uniref:Transposable element Tcb2 transposase n=1 Tax=Trichonephila clavipes TaxID=2585209 RepID=A0A8X6WI91_TRICX|nr:transposable element Tcb2 transposase [Trichonephila clavipes]